MYKLNKSSLFIFFIAISLFGCGNHENGQPSSQVAAKVNGNEISIHQINQVLKSTSGLTAEAIPAARKQILDKLIDEEIAIEQANKENIDRNSDVILAIESAKRQIIANAYITKLVTTSSNVSDADIKEYFDGNPALFSQRKVYGLQDITIQKQDALKLSLDEELPKLKSYISVIDWFKSHNVNYLTDNYVRPAEQISLDVLKKLQVLNPGDSVVIDLQDNTHIIFLSTVQLAPVDIKTAGPSIKRFLINTRAKELVLAKMKDLKAKSNIEYMGEFSSKASNDQKSVIEKGVAG